MEGWKGERKQAEKKTRSYESQEEREVVRKKVQEWREVRWQEGR